MPIAPMIAALLLDSAIGGGTYVVMDVLVSIGVLSMAVMPNTGKPQQSERRSPLSDLIDGVRYVHQRPTLRLMILLFMATVVIGFMFRVLTPALLEQHLERASTDMGLMMTVFGIASAVLAVGLLADMLGEREVLVGVALLTFVVVGVGVLGWLAVRKHEGSRPAIRLTPSTDLRGAQLTANGGASAPPLLRPVALMSGQKLDH